MDKVKEITCLVIGAIGSAFSSVFGGFDFTLGLLIFLMATDYITGIVVAYKGKSKKTNSGKLSSNIGFKGLAKKFLILVYVMIAVQLDKTMKIDYIRDMVVISYSCNEVISIAENIGLSGVTLPKWIEKGLEILLGRDEK